MDGVAQSKVEVPKDWQLSVAEVAERLRLAAPPPPDAPCGSAVAEEAAPVQPGEVSHVRSPADNARDSGGMTFPNLGPLPLPLSLGGGGLKSQPSFPHTSCAHPWQLILPDEAIRQQAEELSQAMERDGCAPASTDDPLDCMVGGGSWPGGREPPGETRRWGKEAKIGSSRREVDRRRRGERRRTIGLALGRPRGGAVWVAAYSHRPLTGC